MQSARMEDRPLPVGGWVALDGHLEPREPRQSHLGAKSQHVPGLALLDPPEVQRLAHHESVGVPAASTQPDTSYEPVEKSTGLPCEGERVPPTFTADTLDDPPQGLGGSVASARSRSSV